jgi:hypothetical protein
MAIGATSRAEIRPKGKGRLVETQKGGAHLRRLFRIHCIVRGHLVFTATWFARPTYFAQPPYAADRANVIVLRPKDLDTSIA